MRTNRMRSVLNPGGRWAVARWTGALFVASSLAVLGACNGPAAPGAPSGSLAIVVESDMMIPRDIDHIRVEVTQHGSSLVHVEADVGPAATLIPALYQVKATTDSSPVTVQAVGYQAGQLRVERDAITPIPTDHEGVIRLALNYLCVGDAHAGVDGGVTSTCPAGLTCEQGSCRSSTVPASSVPTYDPATVNGSATFDASVEGGAGVGCFDVQDCFASAMPVTLDAATCSITLPAAAAGAGVNVALQFPAGGAGVCGDKDCWVVLNEGSDWTESGTTISLPAGACTSPAAKSAVIVVTTACASKTEATPECGPWSSVPTVAVVPGPGMGGLGTSCMGAPSQACGNCGTQTRTCTNGMWSDWSTCSGTGVCAPNATQACEESGTQTCGANCQWAACGCTAGETACGGTCVTVSTDVHNCGACGTDCTMLAHVNGASAACTAGHCSYGCAAGYADCSDGGAGCTASLSAATSCGACGSVCSTPLPMCAAADAGGPSTCLSQCSGAASTMCNGSCVDTQTDPGHCGACGNACAAGSTCEAGVCTCQGPKTQTCGNCGTQSRTCPAGVWSAWSDCTETPPDACGPGATKACDINGSETCGTDCKWSACTCNPGDTLCGTACVNEQSDPQNCGSCGFACPSGGQCVGGTCACPLGRHACGGDGGGGGACDSNLSLITCGSACNSPCPVPANGTAACDGVTCGINCNMGFSACGGVCVNEQTDNANCGSCGNVCSTSDPNAAGDSCNGRGTCVVTCKMGYTLCNGVCVNEKIDNANCGACGNACTTSDPNATGASCNGSGVCVTACKMGDTLCGGVCVNEKTDTANCGTCSNICASVANGAPVCNAGTCGFTCNASFSTCVAACVNEQTDGTHCGSCGNDCIAGSTCQGGSCSCTLPGAQPCGTCNTGTTRSSCNANGSVSTTCIGGANLQSDSANCGACGNACTGNDICLSGSCTSCGSFPETACNGACSDVQFDDANCGGCGNACGSGTICNMGSCVPGVCGKYLLGSGTDTNGHTFNTLYDVVYKFTWQMGWFNDNTSCGTAPCATNGTGIDLATAEADCAVLGSGWLVPTGDELGTTKSETVIGGCGFEVPSRPNGGFSTVQFWTDNVTGVDPYTDVETSYSSAATTGQHGSVLGARCINMGP